MKIGKMTECPKCGLEAKSMLHPFCQHKECPVRDGLAKSEPVKPMTTETDECRKAFEKWYFAQRIDTPDGTVHEGIQFAVWKAAWQASRADLLDGIERELDAAPNAYDGFPSCVKRAVVSAIIRKHKGE